MDNLSEEGLRPVSFNNFSRFFYLSHPNKVGEIAVKNDYRNYKDRSRWAASNSDIRADQSSPSYRNWASASKQVRFRSTKNNHHHHPHSGGSAAIVGPSGSGKSSIFALLQRMYTATSGEVVGRWSLIFRLYLADLSRHWSLIFAQMLDNINVRSINPQYLRRVVVSVGQEPTLFSFTIRYVMDWSSDRLVLSRE